MLRIKQILNDIVDTAYADSEKKDLYKKFYVEVSAQNMKSFHGDYRSTNHHIRIFNTYRDDASIVVTTIHELTHHVDFVNRGKTDHSKEFYSVFKDLLFAALDMNLFTVDKFLSATSDASDSNKVKAIIKDYVPKEIGYKNDKNLISVKNGYAAKEVLKSRGYMFNKVNGTWEREVESECMQAEKFFLENLYLQYEVTSATSIAFSKKTYIVAGKGSFEIRDKLKQDGFSYDSKLKSWKKPYTADELQTCKLKYPDVEIYLLK